MADDEVIELAVIDDDAHITVGVEDEEMSIAMTANDVVIESVGNNQDKTVTPTKLQQEITADEGYSGLGTVTVEPIPPNYGLITWNGTVITVS